MKTTLRTATFSLTTLYALSALVTSAHAHGLLSLVASTDKPVAGRTVSAFGPPALNNLFSVAFVAKDPSGNPAIFAQNSWVVELGQTIERQTIKGLSIASAPGLNDSGTVSFWAQFSGGDGIFTQNGIRAQSGQTIGGYTLDKLYGPTSLNNSGEVVFNGHEPNGHIRLFSDTAELIPVDVLPDFRPALNNSGFVAALSNGYVAGQSNLLIGGQSISGLFPRPSNTTASSPAVNANYVVVVGTQALVNATQTTVAIFTQSSVVAKIGAVIGGELITSFRGLNNAGDPVINDAGTIAFAANFNGGSGIFTQYGLLAKTGDIVDGKVIHDVDNPAINGWGAVAFRVSFTDGSKGIVVYSSLFGPNSLLTTFLSNNGTVAIVKAMSLRLTAGAPADGQCQAELGFVNSNGSPVGPSLRVNLASGQTESLTLDSDIFGLTVGQRMEVRSVVTPLAGLPSRCEAIAEVVDNQTGLTSIVVPVTAFPPTPIHLPPMEVATGQTLRLNAVADGSTLCSAQFSFVDSTGKPVGPTSIVNLFPGQAGFLDIRGTATYQLLRPVVTPVPGPAPSPCGASAELFDQASGRTLAYATGQ
jgi:hypothetical protein